MRYQRIAIFLIGFILILLLLLSYKSKKNSQFKEFRSDEGRLTILMPGKPQRETQEVNTPAGIVKMVMYTAESKEIICICAYTDYPQQHINLVDSNTILDGAMNGAVNNIKGKLINQKSFEFHDLPARDIQMEIPKQAFVDLRFILAGERFYQLMLIAPGDKGHQQDIAKFFDSFKIDGVN